MSQKRDTGIVLSKKSSGEADNICSIYTKNSGKDKFIFRGLKKSSRRPRTASEPGSVLDIIYYTGKTGNLNTVSELDILNNHNSIRKSSDKIFTLYYMLELVDLTTGFTDPNIKVFNLLSAGIETLSVMELTRHFAVFFTVKYLLSQGVFPDTARCSWCENSNPEQLLIESGFRISCVNCGDIKSAVITGRGIEFINKCVSLKLDKIDCSNYSDREILSILSMLIEYINSYYSIKLKTGSILINPVSLKNSF